MAGLLAFRLWGDHAHFKKYYTSTSPLTFEFPPPPTLIGIVSAIIGLDRDSYLSRFQKPDDFRLSVRIDKPVKKVRWSQNLVNTLSKRHFMQIQNRTQIRIEFLKDAAFTVYFSHEDAAIYSELKTHLENHTSVYSISLGLSELLANFEFLGEFDYTICRSDEWIHLDSVLPVSRLRNETAVDFSSGQEIFKVNYPILMEEDRVVTKREDVLFERKGNRIRCMVNEFCETEKGDRIVFF